MTKENSLDRRSFLKTSLAAGGALLIGFNLPLQSRAESRMGAGTVEDLEPNAFIRISKDGSLTVRIGQAEMGQGVLTSLAMIVADELEIDWENVSYEAVGADAAFANPLFGMQVTGGSTTIRGFYNPLRKSAAAAREMIVSAAAAEWGVEPDECRAESGKVAHAASGRSAAYGDLFERAATLTPPAEPKLKDPKDFKIIGKDAKRLDSAAKSDGTAIFGIDVKLPGLLTAQIVRSPVFGGKVSKVDDKAALAVKGVKAVVPLGYGVGVVADSFWAARSGRRALKIDWDLGPNAAVSSESIYKDFAEAAANGKGKAAKKSGDAAGSKSKAVKTVESEYFLPFLAHATMEPLNFTADVRADGCDVYGGSQAQGFVQMVAAQITGMPPDKIKVHQTLLGGGFGRRAELDFVTDAILLSKAVGKPVKVIWTREDDTQQDVYRPASYSRISAGLGADGKPLFWHHRIVNSSIMARVGKAFGFPPAEIDDSSVEGANDIPYEIPNVLVEWVEQETGVPVGFWRSVGHSHTAFVVESFLDELASAAGVDPYEFRKSLLEKDKRKLAVLNLAAEKAGWGTKPAAGISRGIAMHESFGSIVAQVAEVSVSNTGKVDVRRVVCAVDCGSVVNPDTVKAQMEGGIVFGLTAALYGEVGIKDGGAVERNFNNYKMLRIDEMPAVEVHIMPSTESPGGVGEPGTPPIAPAVANAIFAGTGKRIRKLPIGVIGKG
ncbi:MAG: xanthine dehydrogenase family protein molybdopterin-binding subunit [Acidobacteriota bacterium]|nr:xanthine dehydrogenase family protein molybdopterin-binding subunit [Acidobacteriota bacterium]